MKCYITDTRAEVDTGTVQYFPHQLPLPETTTTDFLRKAALDILTLLKHHQEYLPSLSNGDSITTVYAEFAKLLHRDEVVPTQAQHDQVAMHIQNAIPIRLQATNR